MHDTRSTQLFDVHFHLLYSVIQGSVWLHPDANLTAVFGRWGVQSKITINCSIKQSWGGKQWTDILPAKSNPEYSIKNIQGAYNVILQGNYVNVR